MQGAKPYEIDKQAVYEAYRRVKANGNGGSAGIDGIEMKMYEKNQG